MVIAYGHYLLIIAFGHWLLAISFCYWLYLGLGLRFLRFNFNRLEVGFSKVKY